MASFNQSDCIVLPQNGFAGIQFVDVGKDNTMNLSEADRKLVSITVRIGQKCEIIKQTKIMQGVGWRDIFRPVRLADNDNDVDNGDDDNNKGFATIFEHF